MFLGVATGCCDDVDMAPTGDPLAKRRALLGALLTQRRTQLGWTKKQVRQESGMTVDTFMRLESGQTVHDQTYAKIEGGFGFVPGACQAVLDGAVSMPLLDGGEVVAGGAPAAPGSDVEGLPSVVQEELLREGRLLASDVYDLLPDGGGDGPQLIAIIKAPAGATPAQIKAYTQAVKDAQRKLRRISERPGDEQESNTP